MKRYDLMHQINARGTWLVSRACIPHLLKAENPHILNNSPPLNLNPAWFGPHVAYTMAKYGMSLCVLGMAEEFKGRIGVNALWPATAIATSAMDMIGGEAAMRQCRKPEIMADAAHALLVRDARSHSGRFLLDEEVLREEGMVDFDGYAVDPGAVLIRDYFLD
jgi:citronellol/citronellal dehydrogenase